MIFPIKILLCAFHFHGHFLGSHATVQSEGQLFSDALLEGRATTILEEI